MTNTMHATTNYKALMELIPELLDSSKRTDHKRFEAAEYMPLSFDFLYRDGKNRYVIAMAHNGTQNGDLMADPDMEIALDPIAGVAEPLTYQNDYMGVYQQVYIERDGVKMYSRQLRIDLDNFLWHWLQNISEQGYKAVVSGED